MTNLTVNTDALCSRSSSFNAQSLERSQEEQDKLAMPPPLGPTLIPSNIEKWHKLRGIVIQVAEMAASFRETKKHRTEGKELPQEVLQKANYMDSYFKSTDDQEKVKQLLLISLEEAFDCGLKDFVGNLRCEVSATFFKIYLLGHVKIPLPWRSVILKKISDMLDTVIKKCLLRQPETDIKVVARLFEDLVSGSTKTCTLGISLQSLHIVFMIFNAILPIKDLHEMLDKPDELKKNVQELRLSASILKKMRDCFDHWNEKYRKKEIACPSQKKGNRLRKKIAALTEYLDLKTDYCFRVVPLIALEMRDVHASLERLECTLDKFFMEREQQDMMKRFKSRRPGITRAMNASVEGIRGLDSTPEGGVSDSMNAGRMDLIVNVLQKTSSQTLTGSDSTKRPK